MIARHRGRIELALVVAGLICAAASAGFAFYMTTSERQPTFSGSEHLRIFAQPASRVRERREPATPAFDINPTGSIPVGEPQRASLPGWSVQDSNAGSALVLGPRGLMRATPGVDLGEAGVVERIDIGRAGWSVVTTRGVIGDPR